MPTQSGSVYTPVGVHQVAGPDINGVHLSALKSYLPIGQLEHDTAGVHDRGAPGVHLITSPAW
ncbi:hypothetical protein ABZ904_38280 [Streptomyces sp. NPDC046900]|uniref:hypothetical protein n=1 Tax=Streptomyces sp. NPDC046900 TaxID=3155473 RepID=UPI0033C2885A